MLECSNIQKKCTLFFTKEGLYINIFNFKHNNVNTLNNYSPKMSVFNQFSNETLMFPIPVNFLKR